MWCMFAILRWKQKIQLEYKNDGQGVMKTILVRKWNVKIKIPISCLGRLCWKEDLGRPIGLVS